MRSLPSISLDTSLHDSLYTENKKGLRVLGLGDFELVAYTRRDLTSCGREVLTRSVALAEDDLRGTVFLNPNFFRGRNNPRKLEPESGTKNFAKTFFLANGLNHVALVQYLPSGERTYEHYHTTEESIVQLGGSSFVNLRPVEEDTNYQIVELSPGQILRIPPRTLHYVQTLEQGSLTFPVKQTFPGKKDHLYHPRSQPRISQELTALLDSPSYQSGDEVVAALKEYSRDLRTDSERERMIREAEILASEATNPNARIRLREFIEEH
ncbi:MAG: cupin domain-containing protein [Candidatus Nanoarchaeia archaeon]|nr:cupin domain-containing protein [Candidatus Nanoarchaeia archaeon]